MPSKHLVILGTHGIPARHGGFETCAEKLALHMHKQGWQVTVYGQADQSYDTEWNGIHCVYTKRFTSRFLRYLNPLLYDLSTIWQARKTNAVFLTMGYNTALFNLILKFYGRRQIINMDGMEWKRSKYKRWHEKAWLRFNEWIALRLANICIADHAEIARYLSGQYPKARIETIAYGADPVTEQDTDKSVLARYNIEPYQYGLIIARPEPENSILEIVTAWHKSEIQQPLIILGNYKPDQNYHRAVRQAAGSCVQFVGAVYDPVIVKTLRFYAAMYLHGHQVGGTNPSLVEAMAANRPIIAHDNVYNRGVCVDGALYFSGSNELTVVIRTFKDQADLNQKAYDRYLLHYQWPSILQAYQAMLEHPA